MTLWFPRAAPAAVLALSALLAACASDPNAPPPANPLRPGETNPRELRLEAEELYRLARRSLDSSDFAGALLRYNQILLRFPFTDIATQAQLESVYARYRSFDPDGALSAADRFLKEHPRHPAGDYVYYLKGLINFQRGDVLFAWLTDASKQDVGYARRAFDDFSLLTQRYPGSRYAADARLRMIHLRNQIAEHEMHVVRYYVRRGAHIAAAKRAETIIAEYPGAPATLEALAILENSYREVGLVAQAEQARRLREANPAPPASQAEVTAPAAPAVRPDPQPDVAPAPAVDEVPTPAAPQEPPLEQPPPPPESGGG